MEFIDFSAGGKMISIQDVGRARKGTRSCERCRTICCEDMSSSQMFVVTYFSGVQEYTLYRWDIRLKGYSDYKTKAVPIAKFKTLKLACLGAGQLADQAPGLMEAKDERSKGWRAG